MAAVPESWRMPAQAQRIRSLLAGASEAWPGLHVEPERFLAFVSGHAAGDLGAAEGLHVADLYLAFGCGLGKGEFIQALERVHGAALRRGLGAPSPAHGTDDFMQTLREKLFVGGGSPKILEYAGRGPLGIWLTVVAKRTFLDQVRGAQRTQDRELAHGREAIARIERRLHAPELAYLKEKYRAEFKTAFAEAIADLDSRGRTILRLSLVQQLTHAQIASAYGVHRVTVSRWMEDARARILDGTRSRLSTRLNVEHSELTSILRLIESRMDVSLSRVLEAVREHEPDE